MITPDIINYLLSLRYPSSDVGRGNSICYMGGYQLRAPLVAPGATVSLTARPLAGVFAWLGWRLMFGSDTVPNAFTGIFHQYGTTPYSGPVSGRVLEDGWQVFNFVTEQEPTYMAITNVSPITQRWEVIGLFITIPTPQDMAVVIDALRRLHTSEKTEELLQQAVNLLGLEQYREAAARQPIPRVGR